MKYKKKYGRKDAWDKITDQILADLDKGVIPWRKPWSVPIGEYPHNAVTKRRYSGINAIVTGSSDYTDPRWVTWGQARGLGGNVRAGQRGTTVVWWKATDKSEEQTDPKTGEVLIDEETGQPVTKTKKNFFLGGHTIFNVQQCENLDLPELDPDSKPEFDPIERAEEIVQGYTDRPPVVHDGGDQAYYIKTRDTIHLPKRQSFDGADEYYSTLFHEFGHSTGHSSRLDRPTLTESNSFGSHDYGREELTAEFNTAYLTHEAGIKSTLENSTAYLDNWKKAIKADKKIVERAGSLGWKSAEYILNQ